MNGRVSIIHSESNVVSAMTNRNLLLCCYYSTKEHVVANLAMVFQSEVIFAMKALKKSKAAGIDDLPADLLIATPADLLLMLV